ncbi:MAG TPA: glutamate formimidoyltransferase [Solirubrobacterales bacterium]|nr:glutamate formimidoyltransferase [Solirubrobacterales bacterium]
MALAVPNFSEGRDREAIDAIAAAFASAEILDRHSDAAHNRTVLTLAASEEAIVEALIAGARACVERIDMRAHEGAHPCIGALDVCPLVWVEQEERGPAGAMARRVATGIAALDVPVFLYGELASEPARRERAYFRRGGLAALGERMHSGELVPDVGPAAPHPTAGATLVTARAPLAAFNVELDTADLEVARAIAAELRESGGGLPGVRAVGVSLGDRAQVSTNVHDPGAVPLAAVVEAVRDFAAGHGASPVACEIVGLVPEAALAGLPADVPVRGLAVERHMLERRLAAAGR